MLKHIFTSVIVVICLLACAVGLYAFGPSGRSANTAREDEGSLLQAIPPTPEAARAWQAFKDTEGKEFSATWNTATKTPHRVQGKGIKIAAQVGAGNVGGLVAGFVRSNAALLGVNPSELRVLSQEKHGPRWYTDFQQTYSGLDVVGGRVHVRVKDDGTVTAFGSDFYPNIAISTSPAISTESALLLAKGAVSFDESRDNVVSSRLVVLPMVRSGEPAYYLAYETLLKIAMDPASGREPAVWRLYVDASSGDILKRQNEIRFDAVSGTVSGDIKPMYITDPDVQEEFADHYVTATGYPQATTNASGFYSIEVGSGGDRTVTSAIRGRWASVTNNGGAEAAFSDTVPPGSTVDVRWTSSNSTPAEPNIYYHAGIAHQRIKEIDPSFTGMDRQTPIQVNEPNYCNGYWDGNLILLGAGQGSCLNLAMFSDVLYHEYGHGITDKQYGTFSPSGAMHEGFSDYYACTITNESWIGEGISGPGTYFRNCDNTMKYPDDLTGEVHNDGSIIAGALWDMREALYPNVALSDSLFHYARYGKADNFFDYYSDVLETDDDDGNLANGTPHAFAIIDAFGRHGIGPGLYIDIAHVPVHDTEVVLPSFSAVAVITSNLALDADSLLLYYSTGGAFTALPMLPTANPDEYSATIPGQPYGTTVSYYIYAKADGQNTSASDPEGAPANVHSFSIGTDTEPPVIVHTPLADQPDAGWPATVTATVTDNLGLASVVLEYTKNGTAQPPVAMTSAPGTDQYQGVFEVAASAGDYIEYRIVATDASAGALSTADPASYYHVFGIADAQAYTFETGAEGWTHSAQSGWTDQWHVSTLRNHTPGGGQSWRCGDTGANPYANHLGALLETPYVELGENAMLVFWYWIEAETFEPVQGSGLAWDGGAVTLVDSAGKATSIDPVGGFTHKIIPDSDAPFPANKGVYSGNEGWKMATFDLSAYQGRVKIRFKFGSDMAVGFEGWYIDDVMIWSQGVLAGVNPGEIVPGNEIPVACALANPLPNPSSGNATISYAVASPGSHVTVRVFDVQGRLAATLVDETKIPGRYSVTWNGRDLAGRDVSSGVYFVMMEAKNFRAGSKLIMMK